MSNPDNDRLTPFKEKPMITLTINVEDAWALCLGPLEYAVESSAGRVPKGGSPYRVRQQLKRKLEELG